MGALDSLPEELLHVIGFEVALLDTPEALRRTRRDQRLHRGSAKPVTPSLIRLGSINRRTRHALIPLLFSYIGLNLMTPSDTEDGYYDYIVDWQGQRKLPWPHKLARAQGLVGRGDLLACVTRFAWIGDQCEGTAILFDQLLAGMTRLTEVTVRQHQLTLVQLARLLGGFRDPIRGWRRRALTHLELPASPCPAVLVSLRKHLKSICWRNEDAQREDIGWSLTDVHGSLSQEEQSLLLSLTADLDPSVPSMKYLDLRCSPFLWFFLDESMPVPDAIHVEICFPQLRQAYEADLTPRDCCDTTCLSVHSCIKNAPYMSTEVMSCIALSFVALERLLFRNCLIIWVSQDGPPPYNFLAQTMGNLTTLFLESIVLTVDIEDDDHHDAPILSEFVSVVQSIASAAPELDTLDIHVVSDWNEATSPRLQHLHIYSGQDAQHKTIFATLLEDFECLQHFGTNVALCDDLSPAIGATSIEIRARKYYDPDFSQPFYFDYSGDVEVDEQRSTRAMERHLFRSTACVREGAPSLRTLALIGPKEGDSRSAKLMGFAPRGQGAGERLHFKEDVVQLPREEDFWIDEKAMASWPM